MGEVCVVSRRGVDIGPQVVSAIYPFASSEHVTQLIIFFSSSHSFYVNAPLLRHTTIHHNIHTCDSHIVVRRSPTGRDKRKRNLSRKPQSFMPSPVSANAVTTPCEKKKSKKRMRNTELTSNIPPLFDKVDEDLARRLVDQKLHAAAHAVRRFMQTHGAAMSDLERFEPQIRKEGRYREYMALVRLIGQVNKSFESLNASGHMWIDYL